MRIKSKPDLPSKLPMNLKDARHATQNDLIHVLDALRRMAPHLRRFLRDFPAKDATMTPPRSRVADVLLLRDAGLLTRNGNTHHLTRLGLLAQGEIWAAERYVMTLTFI